MFLNAHTSIRTHTSSFISTQTHTHAHTHTYAYKHTHTHTYTHSNRDRYFGANDNNYGAPSSWFTEGPPRGVCVCVCVCLCLYICLYV
jgi:hypothetical protein